MNLENVEASVTDSSTCVDIQERSAPPRASGPWNGQKIGGQPVWNRKVLAVPPVPSLVLEPVEM